MRKSNVELLRVISMLMIVCLHYLSKGGALVNPENPLFVNGVLAWLIEAFCLVAVNVYVLISGYFATPQSATYQKTLKLWIQVMFYNLIIGVIAMCVGAQAIDLYAIIDLFFPIVTEQYWFATVFILLSLLAPFLQNGVEKLDQKTFRAILISFLVFASVSKTFLPMQLPWDKNGYDIVWFLCVYMTGMYLKRYGLAKILQKRINSFVLYMLCEGVIFFSMLLIRAIYLQTKQYAAFIHYGYSYNYLLCYFGAISLFAFFIQGEECSKKIAPLMNTLGSATFGVYLFHEHKNIRYVWVKWMNCDEAYLQGTVQFLLHMIVSVLLVFVVGVLIELARQKLFQGIVNKIKK